MNKSENMAQLSSTGPITRSLLVIGLSMMMLLGMMVLKTLDASRASSVEAAGVAGAQPIKRTNTHKTVMIILICLDIVS